MSTTTHSLPHGSYLMPSLAHATVADAMHPGIISCEPDVPLSEVARIMASRHVHCVAVIGISHEEPECFVWGIISDLDVVRAGIEDGSETTARALAGHPIVSVDATTPLPEAGRLMLSHKVSHLVVIDPERQRPVGVLSSLDIAGVLGWGEG
jgi:CBS domain-containing protein